MEKFRSTAGKVLLHRLQSINEAFVYINATFVFINEAFVYKNKGFIYSLLLENRKLVIGCGQVCY